MPIPGAMTKLFGSYNRRCALAAAVKTWIEAADEELHGEVTASLLDEADIILDKVCVEQGIYKAGDEAYFERGAREHGLVHIFCEDKIIQIDTDGRVEEF
jgi:hypothetical protein